jgi:hypothetical protein
MAGNPRVRPGTAMTAEHSHPDSYRKVTESGQYDSFDIRQFTTTSPAVIALLLQIANDTLLASEAVAA